MRQGSPHRTSGNCEHYNDHCRQMAGCMDKSNRYTGYGDKLRQLQSSKSSCKQQYLDGFLQIETADSVKVQGNQRASHKEQAEAQREISCID